jgi:hypothetical protein
MSVEDMSVEEWEAENIREVRVVVEIHAYLAGSYLTTNETVNILQRCTAPQLSPRFLPQPRPTRLTIAPARLS